MEKRVLSAHDIDILKEMARAVRERRQNTANRPAIPPEMAPAPEIYVALTPEDGIPALIPTSDSGEDFDIPGSAECQICQITMVSGTPFLTPVIGLFKLVYNLSVKKVEGFFWQVVKRDKFGKWFCENGLSSQNTSTMEWVRITSIQAHTPTAGTASSTSTSSVSEAPKYYLGLVQDFSIETGEFFDRPASDTGTATDIHVWLFMQAGYIPEQNDVDFPIYFLARRDPNQLSDKDVYIVLDGVTISVHCHDPAESGTAFDTEYEWYAGRLVKLTTGGTGTA